MESTQNIICSLAKSMGVSEIDVRMMVQGIVDDFARDGLENIYVNSDINTQCDLLQAYAMHQVKKFRNFHTTYLTNSQAARAFQESVYALAKNPTNKSKR
ncbi:hypothetical protein OKZ62_001884 [Vibrio navarrensis]|nr:hypothetical protein [Vibrio navarrensis]